MEKIKTGDLYETYLKWKRDPERYGDQMSVRIDRIIHKALSNKGHDPIYYKTEDRDDMIQDIRVAVIKALNRVENPDNKRLYNYLRVTVDGAWLDRNRKLGRMLDREKVLSTLPMDNCYVMEVFSFRDPLLQDIARLLLDKTSEQEICSKLNISKSVLKKKKLEIGKILLEERHEKESF